MSKPDLSPPELRRASSITDEDTGIAVGATDEGLVMIACIINGREKWIENLHPEEAEDIARMIVEESAKARARRIA